MVSRVCRELSEQPGHRVRLALRVRRERVGPKGQEAILGLSAHKARAVRRVPKARRDLKAISDPAARKVLMEGPGRKDSRATPVCLA
jgi:hypothetical protein